MKDYSTYSEKLNATRRAERQAATARKQAERRATAAKYDAYLADLDDELFGIISRLVSDTGLTLEALTPLQRTSEHLAKARLIIKRERERLLKHMTVKTGKPGPKAPAVVATA